MDNTRETSTHMTAHQRNNTDSAISAPRADADAKTSGAEKFAADLYPEGLVWAGVKRSGIPCGRLDGLDTAEAARLPGVIRILTAKDIGGTNRQGIIHKDQPVLVESRIRHAGDALALVLAEDRQSLRAALDLIRPVITPLPGVFDPVKALARKAPLVHEEKKRGNLLFKTRIDKGDIGAGFANSSVILRGNFSTPMQAHAFLETENGVARLRRGGVLEMTVSTQAPFRDRFEIAHALGLDPWKIKVKAPSLGGGFGGKDGATVQCMLALAALHVGGRWVKMVWDREENMLAGYKRHAAKLFYRLGAAADGTLLALSCRLFFDTGPYAHLGAEILTFGMEHAGGPYHIPNVRIDGRAVYSNNPIGGAFRGFGATQTGFAMERMLDRLARRLGADPLELRLRNALRPDMKNCAGVPMRGPAGAAECLEAVRAHPFWTDRETWLAAAPAFTRRGVGVSASFVAMGYGRGLPDAAAAKLELTKSGTFRIYNSIPDMGQGNACAFRDLAARALNQSPESIELVSPDTGRCLPGGSSAAGRTTYVYGAALLTACETMRAKLLHRAALVFLKDELAGLELLPGKVTVSPGGREIALNTLAGMMPRDDRICVDQFLMPVVQNPPQTCKGARIGFPHLFYSHAAHVVAVEVDELTGAITPVAAVAAVEGGRVLDRQRFEQQIQGAFAQAAGFALTENFTVDQGRILAGDLATYLAPMSPDLPDCEVLAVDSFEETGPGGIKGVGEVGVNGPAPALAGAVEMACGLQADRLPLRAEDALKALNAIPGDNL